MKMEDIKALVLKAIEDNGGIVKKEQLSKLGIDYRRIVELLNSGDIVRVKNGYYTDKLERFSEEQLVAVLFPDAKLCMESALYAYGYIDQKPYGWRLAVDKNTSKSRFKMDYPVIVPYYTEPEVLELGVMEIPFSNGKMKIYNKERMICDCLKFEEKLDRDTFKRALLAYIADGSKDIATLLSIARERKVLQKVQNMIGVWL